MTQIYHKPVLLQELIDSLEIKKNGVYVDLTFGGGGHSREILKRLGEVGKLIAFDNDEDAERNIVDDSRFTFLRQNFIYLMQNSRAIADLICDERAKEQITNPNQFNNILKTILPKGYENKILARIYQSIRIEVNSEIDYLKKLLNQIPQVLKKNGIASIITYHSIEDRLVKRFFKNGCFNEEPMKDDFGNQIKIFRTEKFKTANDFELKNNSRSRSAKLRVAKLI